jgi:hypothetical protein
MWRVLAVIAPLSLLLGMFVPRRAQAGTDWELISDQDGIQVFKRQLEGTSLVEFKARGAVGAPILNVAAVLRGSDRAKEWMHACEGASVIEWLSATRWVSYNRTKSPAFFVHDRDVVLLNDLEVLPAQRKIVIRFDAVSSPNAPPVADAVRMTSVIGRWDLVELGPSSTEVEYQVRADPAGSLPHWMVNWASEQIPASTLKGLRRQVLAPGYESHLEVLKQVLFETGFLGG